MHEGHRTPDQQIIADRVKMVEYKVPTETADENKLLKSSVYRKIGEQRDRCPDLRRKCHNCGFDICSWPGAPTRPRRERKDAGEDPPTAVGPTPAPGRRSRHRPP